MMITEGTSLYTQQLAMMITEGTSLYTQELAMMITEGTSLYTQQLATVITEGTSLYTQQLAMSRYTSQFCAWNVSHVAKPRHFTRISISVCREFLQTRDQICPVPPFAFLH
jgi:hypothetical protein